MHTRSSLKILAINLLILLNADLTLGQSSLIADTVSFTSGDLQLKGLLWKPSGGTKFPAILFNHGSEPNIGRYLAEVVPAFLEQGYAFFVPFRRGQGLSKGQGRYIVDELDSVSKAGDISGRFKLMIDLHETTQLQDQLAALAFLKKQPAVDSGRIAVAGISFGGIQTMLMAGQSTGIRATLNFAGAAMVWERSAEVAAWLKQMAGKTTIPVYFIQAENDFSIKPTMELSAEMKKYGKTAEMKIYPSNGKTPMDGHSFIAQSKIWGPDVFPKLKEWLSK